MGSLRPKALIVLACTFALGSACSPPSSATSNDSAGMQEIACGELRDLDIARTEITLAQSITAGAEIPSPGRQVEGPKYTPDEHGTVVSQPFCRVAATTTPAPGAEIWTEVWLPVGGSWNGKFLGSGNGGAAGGISHARLSDGLARGYAIAYTDVGTHSEGGGYSNPSSFEFGLGKPELQQNYVHRGVHTMTTVGKAVTRAFYGRDPSTSLFVGCSTGGYEALGEAHRYPDDYDGIISGGMPTSFANVALFQGWVSAVSNRAPGAAIPPEKLPAIAETVVAQCDVLDGILDGVIDDPRRCNFDPSSMLCPAGDAPSCLTAVQAETAAQIYGGVRNPGTGELIYPGFLPGSELSPGAKTRLANDDVGSLINANTPAVAIWELGGDWSAEKWLTFDFDKDAKKLQADLEWLEHGDTPEKMSAFRENGGKLILFGGWNDPNLNGQDIVNFYESVEAVSGGPSQNDFVRLFMAPGMYHCRGGPGPNDFGQTVRANQSGASPDNDLVIALDRWVTEGIAPEQVIATKYVDDDPEKGIMRTRPICAYPKVARWNGRGTTDEAKNFACVLPEGFDGEM